MGTFIPVLTAPILLPVPVLIFLGPVGILGCHTAPAGGALRGLNALVGAAGENGAAGAAIGATGERGPGAAGAGAAATLLGALGGGGAGSAGAPMLSACVPDTRLPTVFSTGYGWNCGAGAAGAAGLNGAAARLWSADGAVAGGPVTRGAAAGAEICCRLPLGIGAAGPPRL